MLQWGGGFVYGIVAAFLVGAHSRLFKVGLLGFTLLCLAYYGCVLVAVWRASDLYGGAKLWGILAKIFCVLGALQILEALFRHAWLISTFGSTDQRTLAA